MGTVGRSQCGSVLMITVVAMLILLVLGVSFSLLSSIEGRIGLNYKFQAQAVALAEAGLDIGRDAVRTAGSTGGTGFTTWLATHMLASGVALGGGQYSVRIDNDCSSALGGYPAFLEEPACNNTTDNNETAVLTAWAVAGPGRARVRGVIAVDNPWKHVCSDAKPDHGGYCNDTQNTQGNPSVNPADPNDPNGPAAYDELPRPVIGCSRIDPTVHGETTATCAALGGLRLFSQPAATVGTATYPAYPLPASAGGPKLVIMGEDPAGSGAPVGVQNRFCGTDNLGVKYFGYFDCALSTPCAFCGGAGTPADPYVRKGCVRDAKIPLGGTWDANAQAKYHDASTTGGTCGVHTGLVFTGNYLTGGNRLTGNIGSAGAPVIIYAQHDPAGPFDINNTASVESGTGGNALALVGTIVVEGKLEDKNKTEVCTGGPVPSPAPTNPCFVTPTVTSYGYPMAVIAYDPKLPYPTVNPYVPQGEPNVPTLHVGVDFGTPNTVVNGIVYSGGRAEFNPINVNGSTVAFDINLMATSSTYTYVPQYGNSTPPAAFPPGASNPVVFIRKSFITCATYNNESASATTCN